MNNDLISREALKKRLQDRHDFWVNAWGGFSDMPLNDKSRVDELSSCIAEVVNAPTVDIKDQIAGAYNEGYVCGNKEAEKARPQGEWNYIQAGMCVCPFCGAMPHKLYKNYCANCGADMKGGAE